MPWRSLVGLNISKSRAIGNNRIFYATSTLNYRAAFPFLWATIDFTIGLPAEIETVELLLLTSSFQMRFIIRLIFDEIYNSIFLKKVDSSIIFFNS